MKPFLTARQVALTLGVKLETVVEDIMDGQDGNIDALVGAQGSGVWLVPSWEMADDRIERHRARLTRSDTSSAAILDQP